MILDRQWSNIPAKDIRQVRNSVLQSSRAVPDVPRKMDWSSLGLHRYVAARETKTPIQFRPLYSHPISSTSVRFPAQLPSIQPRYAQKMDFWYLLRCQWSCAWE